MFDCVVVGSGFSGAVLAERIANARRKRVLMVEKRPHLGGNCADERHSTGILVHKYGPHIFHTDNKRAFDYVSRFTEWIPYQHKVLAYVDGNTIPLPFNLNSLEMLFPRDLARRIELKLLARFSYGTRVSVQDLLREDDEDLRMLANYVFEKIFKNYTLKQWDLPPDQLSGEVMARVPIVVGKDNRYFQDRYQGVPAEGYSAVFGRMLNNPRIHILLNTDARSILNFDLESGKTFVFGQEFRGLVFYTGALDDLFDRVYGPLQYRPLDLRFETLEVAHFQEVATVNYPNDYSFTRITEFKHIHPFETNRTVILKEYPKARETEADVPYYPVLSVQEVDKHRKYIELTKRFPNLVPLGRLAEFKYYDMDDAIERALTVFEEVLM